jgi:hypothetical protein
MLLQFYFQFELAPLHLGMTRENIRVSDRKGILWSGRAGLAAYPAHKQRYAAVNHQAGRCRFTPCSRACFQRLQ